VNLSSSGYRRCWKDNKLIGKAAARSEASSSLFPNYNIKGKKVLADNFI
jgi:hypothetical protein